MADLLTLLSGRSGALDIIRPGRANLTLVLDRGTLQEVREGGRPLDPLEARARIQELLRPQVGSFEFTPEARRVGPPLNWPVERLLLLAATIEDEWASYRDELPDPRTRFVLRGTPPLLEEPLASFLERALFHLQRGVSGEELARALKLPEGQTLYYLHKLRLLGAVEPVRAWREAGEAAPRPHEGLLQRVLRALFWRGG
ncbi:DUF4388 domain-containing protein [Thermus oshimai]